MRSMTAIRVLQRLAPVALAIASLSQPTFGQTQPPPPVPPDVLAKACVQMQLDIQTELIATIQKGCARVVEILELMAKFNAPAQEIEAAGAEGHSKLSAFYESGFGFLINCERDCQTLLDSYDESPNLITPLKKVVENARIYADAKVAQVAMQAFAKISAALGRLLGDAPR